MKILITGAKGFVGRNMVANMRNIQENKNRTRPALDIDALFEYDLDTDPSLLSEYCRVPDFVLHLAGVNRPRNNEEFMAGNFGFSSVLLDTLERVGNRCPVMLFSSIQATLIGSYRTSDNGRSKLAGEKLYFRYVEKIGTKILVYRFPNLIGKWCRPNYNFAVATFCHNIAHDIHVTIKDRSTELEFLYIDDLVIEILDALEGRERHCEYEGLNPEGLQEGRYCFTPVTHNIRKIAEMLQQFNDQPRTLLIPEISDASFAKKLYTTYLSYLPKEKIAFPPKMNVDARSNFTVLLQTANCGQFSVNISKHRFIKGQHWHNTKREFFMVVSVTGLIHMRKNGIDVVLEFSVSGAQIQAIHMLLIYTHNIINLFESENIVTLMCIKSALTPATLIYFLKWFDLSLGMPK